MESEKKDYKKCMFCDKILDSLLPFKCKRCGNYYCSEHRLPESHNCIVVSHSKKSIDTWKKAPKPVEKAKEDLRIMIRELKEQKFNKIEPYFHLIEQN